MANAKNSGLKCDKVLERDEVLEEMVKKLPKLSQVQYSTRSQLVYLRRIANKVGLYDAASVLSRIIEK